jgi:hypothetical protein
VAEVEIGYYLAMKKQTMTLNLSDREMAAIAALAEQQELSKTAVIRQALRLYQLVNERIRAGETMTFSGDQERIALFIGPGFGEAA